MSSSIAFLIVLWAFFNTESVLSKSTHPKLLVVSYDGFRYDYFDRDVTPYMKNLRNHGTYADHMINVFPTSTFPNHHSIATGFYAENHGVLDTSAYVNGVQTGISRELFQYNKNILPIWTVNEKAGGGKHSGVIMWPGGSYEYDGTLPKHLQEFSPSVVWKTRVDSMISWFTDPENPINFGIMYIEEPDFHEHGFGTNPSIINEQLKRVDEITKYLHEQLEKSHLNDVNVIHLSDHGMVSLKIDHIVYLGSYISDLPYQEILNRSTIVMITPKNANDDTIYNRLKAAAEETNKFEVYKKTEVPERYHFSRNPRIGEIVVIAKNGYAFEYTYSGPDSYKKDYGITVTSESEIGTHGYDNLDSNMHPFFFANGPAFRSECELKPFETVNLFSLFCKILDLTCPTTDGKVEPFNQCLLSPSNAVTNGNAATVKPDKDVEAE